MKISTPEYPKFKEIISTDWSGGWDGWGREFRIAPVSIPSIFKSYICFNEFKNSVFAYGFIGTCDDYYKAFIKTDDIPVQKFVNGRLNKSSSKKAYELIVKQLMESYKQWFMNNLVER